MLILRILNLVTRAAMLSLVASAAFAGVGSLPTDRHERPFPMGVSIGNAESAPFIYAGTAGLRVRPFSNPATKMILSNNHVLGAVGPTLCPNTAAFDLHAPLHTQQPGNLDIGFDPGSDPFYLAGIVLRSIPIDFTGSSNLVDAAISFTTTTLARTEILGVGEPNAAIRFPTLGMSVEKSGRTTGVTGGVISSVNVTSNVDYGADCGIARFVHQFAVRGASFSDAGDSGAAILDESDNTPVGLLFAGSATRTLANPMPFVYLSLNVFADAPDAPPSRVQAVKQAESLMQDTKAMARMKRLQRREEAGLFAIPGVVGMGIGQAADGESLSLVIYTDSPSERARAALPLAIDGSPVTIVESGPFVAR